MIINNIFYTNYPSPWDTTVIVWRAFKRFEGNFGAWHERSYYQHDQDTQMPPDAFIEEAEKAIQARYDKHKARRKSK